MNGWIEIGGVVLTIAATAALQEIRWRRRVKAQAALHREEAYDRLLAITDLTYSVGHDVAALNHGLHWWNGASRLRVMKATKLDDRILELTDELARAVSAVRVHGSDRAIEAADVLLEAIAAPLLRHTDEHDQRESLFEARSSFLSVVRQESGSRAS